MIPNLSNLPIGVGDVSDVGDGSYASDVSYVSDMEEVEEDAESLLRLMLPDPPEDWDKVKPQRHGYWWKVYLHFKPNGQDEEKNNEYDKRYKPPPGFRDPGPGDNEDVSDSGSSSK